MNVALQINRSEINDKFGHRLPFHLHVSQSKDRFWRLAQTNKPAKNTRIALGRSYGGFGEFSGPRKKYANRKWSEPEMVETGNDRNRKWSEPEAIGTGNGRNWKWLWPEMNVTWIDRNRKWSEPEVITTGSDRNRKWSKPEVIGTGSDHNRKWP